MNHLRAAWTCVSACCVLIVWRSAVRADNWPQWRGPTDDGICQETNLPTQWGDTKNIVWKLPMPGMGSSTPVIWGDRIFLTSVDGEAVVLLCLSTEGKELWRRQLGTGKRQYMRGEGNDASASPSTDGEHVYAFTGAGDLACFDFKGNEVWKFNVQERYGTFRIMFGMHITPLLFGDRLYLSLLHLGGQWVIALDKATGKEVWKVSRETDGRNEGRQAYASPCLWHNDKETLLIVHGCDYTTAHRLEDGSEVWRLADLNPKDHYNATLRFIASPLAIADLIIVPTAKNGPVVAVKPGVSGRVSAESNTVAWRLKRGTPDVPSPLVYENLVYLCRENGLLMCLDARTGQEYYQQALPRQRYRASPVYADGKIILTGRDGAFSVVKAGPKFELLASNRLPDSFTASPAISNGRIYLRGFETLYAIGNGSKQ